MTYIVSKAPLNTNKLTISSIIQPAYTIYGYSQHKFFANFETLFKTYHLLS